MLAQIDNSYRELVAPSFLGTQVCRARGIPRWCPRGLFYARIRRYYHALRLERRARIRYNTRRSFHTRQELLCGFFDGVLHNRLSYIVHTSRAAHKFPFYSVKMPLGASLVYSSHSVLCLLAITPRRPRFHIDIENAIERRR